MVAGTPALIERDPWRERSEHNCKRFRNFVFSSFSAPAFEAFLSALQRTNGVYRVITRVLRQRLAVAERI